MSPAEIVHRHHAPRRIPREPLSEPPPPASFVARAHALLLTVCFIVVTFGIGWLIWTIAEWRGGRTASFRVRRLRAVRRSDGQPIGLLRSVVRNGLVYPLLLLPTILVCAFLALAFVLGASPPSDLLTAPRTAPWDWLTGTHVIDEGQASPQSSRLKRLGPLPKHADFSMN